MTTPKAAKGWAWLVLVVLAGCTLPESVGHHELVWDKRGCAFLVRKGVAEIRYLYRFPQSDKPPCTITVSEDER